MRVLPPVMRAVPAAVAAGWRMCSLWIMWTGESPMRSGVWVMAAWCSPSGVWVWGWVLGRCSGGEYVHDECIADGAGAAADSEEYEGRGGGGGVESGWNEGPLEGGEQGDGQAVQGGLGREDGLEAVFDGRGEVAWHRLTLLGWEEVLLLAGFFKVWSSEGVLPAAVRRGPLAGRRRLVGLLRSRWPLAGVPALLL